MWVCDCLCGLRQDVLTVEYLEKLPVTPGLPDKPVSKRHQAMVNKTLLAEMECPLVCQRLPPQLWWQ